MSEENIKYRYRAVPVDDSEKRLPKLVKLVDDLDRCHPDEEINGRTVKEWQNLIALYLITQIYTLLVRGYGKKQ